jgi:hypothetical protein
MLNRLIGAVLKAFLMILDKVFLLARKKIVPLYPYDKGTLGSYTNLKNAVSSVETFHV